MNKVKEYYTRFTLGQRIEHWVQVFSFTILAITGLPQKFSGAEWAQNMIFMMGGIETIRIIHRIAAVILLIGVIYHGGYVSYQIFVKRVRLTMLPSWQDAKDFFAVLTYNLGIKRTWPRMPRYNFEEKAEYWAFVWGTLVMVLTGFMLWNPIATSNFFPGSFIPAAKAAHGGEALLAVLAIIVWHFYGVHVRKLNKSMFTGKMSHEDMQHEHALELEELQNPTHIPAPPEEVARRSKVFVPVGTIIAIVLAASLYYFVTFEETAISTVVAATNPDEAYAPLELQTGGNMHNLIENYEGPETCASANCHSGDVYETATTSPHSRRIAAAGPIPALARLVPEDASATVSSTQDCLLCHAETYDPNDLLASVHTVRAAGNDTCKRCHVNHTTEGVHADAGMGCISCHTSMSHKIEREVSCLNCHNELPHSDALINNHTRLDCRTCHINTSIEQRLVDTRQSEQDPVTHFYIPAHEDIQGTEQFAWMDANKQLASIDDENAIIVPVVPLTIIAPPDINPIDFALAGKINGDEPVESTFQTIPGHGIKLEGTRTCATCHGPDADFDFVSLGYGDERADQLSASTSK